jgi:uncharacterized damage-inducible protein DinB
MWDGFDQPAPHVIRPSSELVQGLETTGKVIQQALNRWTVDDLAQTAEWRYGDEIHTYTRQRVIWSLIRHDYHHYGELALTLGMHGLAVPDF